MNGSPLLIEVATVAVDEVYENAPAEDAPAKRGRVADPLNAALANFKAAKITLDKVKAQEELPTLEEAEAAVETARGDLQELLSEM